MLQSVLMILRKTRFLAFAATLFALSCSAAQQEAANAQAANVADVVNEIARKGDTVYEVSIEACHQAELTAADLPDVDKARSTVAEIRKRCDQAFAAVNKVRDAIARVDQLVADIDRGVGNIKALADAALKARAAFSDAEDAQRALAAYLKGFGQ